MNAELALFNTEQFKMVADFADNFTRDATFDAALATKTSNTLAAIDNDLKHFAEFLKHIKAVDEAVNYETFKRNPSAWRHVSHGIIKAFKQHQLSKGFSIATINRRLSTIRWFATLAFEAGVMDEHQHSLIQLVSHIKAKEGRNLDSNRETKRIGRRGAKKERSVSITDKHAKQLKTKHPGTTQGNKDRLLMCLLLDLGLRASEVVGIKGKDIDMTNETIHIYREKTNTHATLRMTKDVRKALMLHDLPSDDEQLIASNRVAVSNRVKYLGISYGYYTTTIEPDARYKSGVVEKKHGTLSSHDCRHYLATKLSRSGLDVHALMETMGWSSMTTAQRYIDDNAIGNEKALNIIESED